MDLDPIYIGAGAGVVLVLALVALKVFRRSEIAEPRYLKLVRAHVAAGRFKEAAMVQASEGNHVEALNLLLRGDCHAEASKLAEELGQFERAAVQAEKAHEFERAAELYHKVDQYDTAARLFQRTGNFRKAAESMERAADTDIEAIAQMWENAYLEAMPQDSQTLTPSGAALSQEAIECAFAAAEAFKKAGANERAANFYELAGRTSQAQALRGRTMVSVMGKMTQMGGADSSAAAIVEGAKPSRELAQLVSTMVKEVIENQPIAIQAINMPMEQVVKDGVVNHMLKPQSVVYIQDSRGEADEDNAQHQNESRYVIESLLGQGGMAVVYKATDTSLDRPVALKFLPDGLNENEMALRFFEREARAAARLNHPNIVTIYDCGVMDNRPFISMEFITGASLDKVLKVRREEGFPGLELGDFLKVAEGLFAALTVAHDNDIVHRDVKPSNIMWTEAGLIKLMDFGIATGNDADNHTLVVGTPFYMAPEQFVGRGIDYRTDLFAAGAALYELFTARPPFKSAERSKPPVSPRQLNPKVPMEIDEIIMRCLAFEPQARPRSTRQLHKIISTMMRNHQDADEDERGSLWRGALDFDSSEDEDIIDLTDDVRVPLNLDEALSQSDAFSLDSALVLDEHDASVDTHGSHHENVSTESLEDGDLSEEMVELLQQYLDT